MGLLDLLIIGRRPMRGGHDKARRVALFHASSRRHIFQLCGRYVGSRRLSLRCDRVSRSWFSCAVISSAARFMTARSWSLVAGEMLSRPSAHRRSASAYLASTQAIQGSSGILSSLIDICDLSLLQSRITPTGRRSGKCVRIEVHDRDTRRGAGPPNL